MEIDGESRRVKRAEDTSPLKMETDGESRRVKRVEDRLKVRQGSECLKMDR